MKIPVNVLIGYENSAESSYWITVYHGSDWIPLSQIDAHIDANANLELHFLVDCCIDSH